jgi:outer membrane immunogenic protein
MKSLVLSAAIVAGLVVGSQAFAADMVLKAPPAVLPPVPFTWTGIYFGGFAGAGWGSEDPTDINQYAGAEGAIPAAGHTWAYPVSASPLLGATLDLDYQVGWLVFGPEFQIGYVHSSGSGPDPLSPGLDVVSSATLGDWWWFAGGRVGFAQDRLLYYGKIGAVFTNAHAAVNDSCTIAPCGPLTINATGSYSDAASLAVGGGIEWAFATDWSVRVEYMYWALHNQFDVAGVASNGFVYNWSHVFSGMSTVMLGLGYTFNWAAP